MSVTQLSFLSMYDCVIVSQSLLCLLVLRKQLSGSKHQHVVVALVFGTTEEPWNRNDSDHRRPNTKGGAKI